MADDTTFTYAGPGDDGVFADPIHEVRFLMKDTTQGIFSLSDQEIQWFLRRTSDNSAAPGVLNTRAAAAAAAEDRAALFAAQAKTMIQVGPYRVQKDYSLAANEMRNLAESLRSAEATDNLAPVVGLTADDSTVPVFALGMTTPRFHEVVGPMTPVQI